MAQDSKLVEATITSVWDILYDLSVEEMLAAPELLTTAFGEKIEEFQAFEAFFTKKDVGADVVPYRHATASYLDEDPAAVAEGGEIPVADPIVGQTRLIADIQKYGLGLRVTWEQIRDDRRDEVADELIAKANTVTRWKRLSALAALNEAPTHELAAATPWNSGGDVVGDLMDSQELILGSVDEFGNPLEYVPSVLWTNPMTLVDITRNDSIQKYFVGNMASEHPIFKRAGELPTLFGGSLAVIQDYAIPRGEAWMGATQTAGKMAQREDEYTSPFYTEDGGTVDERHGKRQTARANYSHRRTFYVDHPKSVVKLTGLAAS